MGKKIDSLLEMYSFGLPAPRCIFIMNNDIVLEKLNEYFKNFNSSFYTIRTDTENSSMSCKRQLTATRDEICKLSHEWHNEGFQIILQEFIDERKEVKSGNIWLRNGVIVLEGAKKHHIEFTNGYGLDINLIAPRFDSYELNFHKFFVEQDCFSWSEIVRLLRLARRVPYTDAMLEFSFFNNGSLYFWEIKKEVRK